MNKEDIMVLSFYWTRNEPASWSLILTDQNLGIQRKREYIPQFCSVNGNFSCCNFRECWYSWEEKKVSINILWSVLIWINICLLVLC